MFERETRKPGIGIRTRDGDVTCPAAQECRGSGTRERFGFDGEGASDETLTRSATGKEVWNIGFMVWARSRTWRLKVAGVKLKDAELSAES
jgi:hypothetical protein